jgi:PDZ and LIM domain protein 5/6/7
VRDRHQLSFLRPIKYAQRRARFFPLSSVNFKKMMPKAGVFKQSEVFQVLNDEQLKSKAERERDEKYQWTTFLQKPQRPPPQRTLQANMTKTYKPTIVKQPKPKCAPDYRAPTPVSRL